LAEYFWESEGPTEAGPPSL